MEPVFQLVANHAELFPAPLVIAYTEVPTSLAQDGDGFLWVGTEAGLERWDGYHFRTYTSVAHDPSALPADDIWVLHTDAKGRLWIGTGGGGLARYDGRNDCFVRIPAGSAGLSDPTVKAIADDGEGGLWVATGGGLDHLDPDLTHVTHVIHNSNDESVNSRNSVITLLHDRDGALWVSTNHGLVRRGRTGADFARVPLPEVNGRAMQVSTLFQNSGGRIWIGTVEDGAYVINPNTLALQSVLDSSRRHDGRSPTEIVAAAEAPTGEIWFATRGAGIIVVDPATLQSRVIRHRSTLPTTLLDDTVESIYRDQSGLMWIASFRGIGYFPAQQGIKTIVDSDPVNGGSADITAMVRMSEDRVAVGTGHGEIRIVDPFDSHISIVDLNPTHSAAILPENVVAALATPDGHELFASTRSGLLWIDPEAQRSAHVLQPPVAKLDVPVFALLVHQQRLWVGGSEGVWVLAREAGWGSRQDPWKVVDQLNLRNVWAISAAPNGDIWLGTSDGLFRYEPATRAVSHIRLVEATRGAADDPFISSLLSDERGLLWVGTNTEGIFVLSLAAIRGNAVVPEKHIIEGLPSRSIDKLLQDTRGQIWASTDRGIARIDAASDSVRAFGRGDGLAISGYWLGSGTTTSQGELIFGGEGGITVIHPGQLDVPPLRPPPLVITSVTVGHRATASTMLDGSGGAGSVQIPAAAHGFSVEFAALDYAAPENIAYTYKLEGYDRDWVQTSAENRTAAYTNIPPGEYSLHLRAKDHAGYWTSSKKILSIRVAAAWYQTPWFHLTEGVAAIAFIWLIVHGRTAILRVRQQELQTRVERQAEQLNRATAERRALIENVAHDLRTPLTSLRGYLETLRMKGLTLSASDQQNYVGIALRQSERLSRLVRELFDLLRLEDGGAKLSREPVQFAELLQDAVQEFRLLAENKLITVQTLLAPDLPLIDGDIDLLKRMIDNLLDNAIRHTPDGGTIKVSLATDDRWVRLEILDTGRGIGRTEIGGIFDRYFRGPAGGATGSAGAGLGLAIVKRIVDLHGGYIAVASEIGVGTRFTIRVARRA